MTLKELNIWGSPYNRGSSQNNAFQSRPDERLSKIPSNLDILLTHGPVKEPKIRQLNPKIHICGHIHNQYGVRKVGDTLSINASIVNGKYKLSHAPIVLDVPISS